MRERILPSGIGSFREPIVRALNTGTAGAAVFLNLFHSSHSDATMLSLKNWCRAYCSMGLGNCARYVVMSCGSVSADAGERAK